MKNRRFRLLSGMVAAGMLFQFLGCGMQDVTNGVADAIKAGVAGTTVEITAIFMDSWLDTAFPTE